jgi:hypothetical protein
MSNDYDRGYVDGIRAFAHWKDGTQYVGTCGMKMSDAIVQRKKTPGYDPPPERPPVTIIQHWNDLFIGRGVKGVDMLRVVYPPDFDGEMRVFTQNETSEGGYKSIGFIFVASAQDGHTPAMVLKRIAKDFLEKHSDSQLH